MLGNLNKPLSSSTELKLNKLLNVLGDVLVSQSCYDDGQSIQSLYRDRNFLSNLDPLPYIETRNKFLNSFLLGVTGLNLQEETSKVKFAFAKCIETIYFLRNLNLILPYNFVASLVQSYTSGSKTVSVLNAKTSPAGSYTTLRKWWNAMGAGAKLSEGMY